MFGVDGGIVFAIVFLFYKILNQNLFNNSEKRKKTAYQKEIIKKLPKFASHFKPGTSISSDKISSSNELHQHYIEGTSVPTLSKLVPARERER